MPFRNHGLKKTRGFSWLYLSGNSIRLLSSKLTVREVENPLMIIFLGFTHRFSMSIHIFTVIYPRVPKML